MIEPAITGLGMYVPERVVTNHELAEMMDTSDEWIQQRSGIVERRYARPDEGAGEMGIHAAKAAIADAGLEPADIDMILFATLSPDYCFPGNGVFVQEALGVSPIPAMDIRNQCTGFLYSLTTADQFVRTGMYKNVLVIGAENHSSGLDFTDRGREVTVLFGDGAGAVVVSAQPEGAEPRMLAHVLHSEGQYAKNLWSELPASCQSPRLTIEGLQEGRQFAKMNGKMVFKHAVTRLAEVVMETLTKSGVTGNEIDLWVPHQANRRINDFVFKQLGVPEEKVVHTIDRYGNTTAATIPISLAEARKEGRLEKGMNVMLAAFGAGFTWGGSVVRW